MSQYDKTARKVALVTSFKKLGSALERVSISKSSTVGSQAKSDEWNLFWNQIVTYIQKNYPAGKVLYEETYNGEFPADYKTELISAIKEYYDGFPIIRSISIDIPMEIIQSGIAVAGIEETPEIPTKYFLEKLSEKKGFKTSFILAIIRAESNFNPNAISEVGAAGLMQLMPATANDLGEKLGFGSVPDYKSGEKPTDGKISKDWRFDPKKNVIAGVEYLSLLRDKYLSGRENSLSLLLTMYHMGPGLVIKSYRLPKVKVNYRYVALIHYYYELYESSSDKRLKLLQELEEVFS